MSYVKENLTRGERLIHTTTLHWVIFFESFSIIFTGLFFTYLGVEYSTQLGSLSYWVEYLSFFVLCFGGIKFLAELLRYSSSEFAVTSERVIIKTGILERKSLAMHLNKIESIEIEQSLTGRILGFGSIIITGTGNAESKFVLLKDPSKFRQQMQWIAESDGDDDEEAQLPGPSKVQPHHSINPMHKSSTTRRRRRRR